MSANAVSWDDQRIFLAVIEEGSLSGAARRLGLSHPTVRSRIEALEAALGVVLFTRSVNGLTPTPTALTLRQAAQTMAAASDLFVRQASGPLGEAAGVVRVSAADFMGVEVLPPMLAALRRRHPGIRVELSLTNAPEDVLAQEVDVAVRNVAPRQAALVARKVASVEVALFASRDYAAQRGLPQRLADLAAHDVIGPDRSPADLMALPRLGLNPSDLTLRTDSHPAQLAAARAGLGIAAMQVPAGERDPLLVRVLPGFSVITLDTWIVAHENLVNTPRVRAVFDGLAQGFSDYRPIAAA